MFCACQRNAAQYHKKAVGELLVEEAENVDDANLGQRAKAKNGILGIRVLVYDSSRFASFYNLRLP